MDDFIKRDNVLAKIDEFVKLNAARVFPMDIFDIEMMRVNIAKIPAADVAPVVHGHWVYGEFDIPHCSECGEEVKPDKISPFCPNCGAKMDEEVNDT